MCHLFIANSLSGYALQGVYPRIANAVAELLLLSPSNAGRKHVGKALTHYSLLNIRARAHLQCRVDAHGNIKKLFVKEWHTTFYAPCHQ